MHRGYAVSYRGSSSFGQDFLKTLVGDVGIIDTQDCLAVLFRVILPHVDGIDLSRIDRKRLIIFGGSHCGFISGNMIGKISTLISCCL